MEKLLRKLLGVGNPKVLTVEYFTCNKYQLISILMKPNLIKVTIIFSRTTIDSFLKIKVSSLDLNNLNSRNNKHKIEMGLKFTWYISIQFLTLVI